MVVVSQRVGSMSALAVLGTLAAAGMCGPQFRSAVTAVGIGSLVTASLSSNENWRAFAAGAAAQAADLLIK